MMHPPSRSLAPFHSHTNTSYLAYSRAEAEGEGKIIIIRLRTQVGDPLGNRHVCYVRKLLPVLSKRPSPRSHTAIIIYSVISSRSSAPVMLVVRAGFALAGSFLAAIPSLEIEVADRNRGPLVGVACGAAAAVTLGFSATTTRFEAVVVVPGAGSELVDLMDDGDLVVEDEGPPPVVVLLVVAIGEDGLEEAWCRSTWPRSRVGSMMLRTSFLRCLTSVFFRGAMN